MRHNRLRGLLTAGKPARWPGYLTLENVVLLPHLGSATVATTMRWASWRWTALSPLGGAAANLVRNRLQNCFA